MSDKPLGKALTELRRLAALVVLTVIALPAGASEAVSEGFFERFSYRGGYLLFQIDSSSGNACAACQGDPAGYWNGGFCWAPATDSTLISFLLSAQAQRAKILVRVVSWQQCEVYQAEIRE